MVGEVLKAMAEIPTWLSLITSEGEDGDGQDREGLLEEVMLNLRAAGLVGVGQRERCYMQET